MPTEPRTLRQIFDSLKGDNPDYKYISYEMLEHIVSRFVKEAEDRGEARALDNIEKLLSEPVV